MAEAWAALSVKYEDVRHFEKIMFRSFLPHLITSGVGFAIYNSKKEGEIVLLGAFALGWLLTPINTVWAYKEYNISVDITQNAGDPEIPGSKLMSKSGNLMLSVSIKW